MIFDSIIGGAEGKMTKSVDYTAWVNDYSTFEPLDLSKISGPNITLFAPGIEDVCDNIELWETIPTYQKTYDYECADHFTLMISELAPGHRAVKDITIVLGLTGAATLSMAAAALASATMFLF